MIDFEKILQSLAYDPKDPLVFNSGFFFFFLLTFLLFYQFLYKRKLTRVLVFTVFSLYFFYKACGWYVAFILIAAVVDFNLSNWIYRAPTLARKKFFLVFSIVINLGLLAYFKYTDFFIQIINDLGNGNIKPLELALPIGISFYTFENLSYTIDVYRGHFKPVTSFWDYCFFLSFFPKLVMGPIVRAADFVPQIRQDIKVNAYDIGHGLFLILGGLFKKVVISDYIYVNYVKMIFADPSRHGGLECIMGVYGYAMVIYCDFSGYSDMAIGIARWMGFSININFNTPYKSTSITEFWRRWHISLSSWLRDYLYIPLGGNRKGKFRTYLNLFITMLLGGLWHGATSWNFVIWGGLHGIGLAFDKIRMTFLHGRKGRTGKSSNPLIRFGGFLLTFHFVCFCWIFFKAKNFQDAMIIIEQIFTNLSFQNIGSFLMNYRLVFLMMAAGYILHFLPRKMDDFLINFLVKVPMPVRILITCITVWLLIQIKQAEPVPPIYQAF